MAVFITKYGYRLETSDEDMIAAYRNAGLVEVEETKKPDKPSAKKSKKAE